jgi:hypothetical protein
VQNLSWIGGVEEGEGIEQEVEKMNSEIHRRVKRRERTRVREGQARFFWCK